MAALSGAGHEALAAKPPQPRLLHEPSHSLGAVTLALLGQLVLDTGSTVAAQVLTMNRLNLRPQRHILLLARTGGSLHPGMIPGAGHSQGGAELSNWVLAFHGLDSLVALWDGATK
ncbi:MAG TPA: hypothetical protein VN648_09840, partial [Candidatus Methylomirabilis sp.]|nr:hypothetical protein [Candidatus Methylomirabilis sp.]